MKKKLTLWIFLFPFVLLGQQTEFKDGALTIDFSKKRRNERDSTVQKKQPAKENKIVEEQEEEVDFKKDGIFKALFGAGLNVSQVDGDEQAGYRHLGAQVGVGVMVKFHKNLSASTEIMYNMKGATLRPNPNQLPQQSFRITWDYVQIPLLLNVHDKKLIMASAGLGFGYLVREKYQYDVIDVNGNTNDTLSRIGLSIISVPPRKFDLSAIVGFQFIIKKVFAIGARFEYSLIGLRPSVGGQTRVQRMYNNTVSLRATYILNPVRKKR